MKKWFVFLLLFLFFAGGTAFASEDVNSLIQGSSAYTNEDQAYLLDRVGEMVKNLEQIGLSTEPIVLKLKEGLRKNVRPYNIVKSLGKKADSLVEAKKILDEVDPGGSGDEALLQDLAISIEWAVPSEVVKEVLQRTASHDGNRVKQVVDSLSSLLEMGVKPQQAGSIIREFVAKNPGDKEISSMTRLIERACGDGIDPQRIAGKMEEVLKKYNNLNMAEIEIQNFIADIKQKPTLQGGHGVVVTSPGITTSGAPSSEGGTPLESSSSSTSSGSVPSQEGGTPLE
ncbi:MAG: hypothetical protein NTW65_06895 [Deltaproteobacteria bacterium]|nr:hypothetical protein [Deltaproteobacteria bacterium]